MLMKDSRTQRPTRNSSRMQYWTTVSSCWEFFVTFEARRNVADGWWMNVSHSILSDYHLNLWAVMNLKTILAELMNERMLSAQHMRASIPRCIFLPSTKPNEVACFFEIHTSLLFAYWRDDLPQIRHLSFHDAPRCSFFSYDCCAKKSHSLRRWMMWFMFNTFLGFILSDIGYKVDCRFHSWFQW